MSAAIRLDGVSYTYPSPRGRRDRGTVGGLPARGLAATSLVVETGGLVAIAGPNGCGKSTLLRLLSTELVPRTGRIELFGQTVEAAERAVMRAVRRKLGVVLAEAALDPVLTVRENLELAAALYGGTRIAQGLAGFNLADRAGERAGALSTGLRRRADLARAMLHGPKLLLLDEPTAGLDAESRRGFLDAIAHTRSADPELTIVLVSHDDDELRAADRVILMADGEILLDDTPAALVERAGAFVADVSDRALGGELSALGLDPRPNGDGLVVSLADRAAADRLLEAVESGGWAVSIRRAMLRDAAVRLGERRADPVAEGGR